MRLRHLLVSVASGAVLALLVGCHQDTTQLAAPQPGAPCGVGTPCYDTVGDVTQYTHQCCPQGYACCGGWPNVGCSAAGECSFVGGMGMRKPGGAPLMVHQYPAPS